MRDVYISFHSFTTAFGMPDTTETIILVSVVYVVTVGQLGHSTLYRAVPGQEGKQRNQQTNKSKTQKRLPAQSEEDANVLSFTWGC